MISLASHATVCRTMYKPISEKAVATHDFLLPYRRKAVLEAIGGLIYADKSICTRLLVSIVRRCHKLSMQLQGRHINNWKNCDIQQW